MKFLQGKEIKCAVREAAATTTAYDLAVAFWGADGAKLAGIPTSARVRIICDAYSGACNPDTLVRLIEMPNVTIKTRAGMHAKTYLTDAKAIVGSANASANGLGAEGVEPGTIEAAVEFEEKDEVAKVKAWFEDQWNAKDAERIGKAHILSIQQAWQQRDRDEPEVPPGMRLLDALLRMPQNFENSPLRVVAYSDSLFSSEAKENYETAGRRNYTRRTLDKLDRKSLYPFYEDYFKWNIEKGDYIIDYKGSVDNKKMKCQGIWRYLTPDRTPTTWIMYVEPVDKVFGLEFSSEDQEKLGKVMSRGIINGDITIPKGSSFYEISLYDLHELLVRYVD